MLNRPHTEEEKRNLSEKLKAHHRSLSAEEKQAINDKRRMTIKRKEDIIKFFKANIKTINKAIKEEKRKHKRDDDIINN